MTVDAAAGRAAAGVLRRAYARSRRSLRRRSGVDLAAGLGHRHNRRAVNILVQDMTGTLAFYLVGALLLGSPVFWFAGDVHARLARFVLLAMVTVPAAVPLAAVGVLQWWAVAYSWRSDRGTASHLGPDEVERLLARGGLAAWRLAVVLGLVAAVALALSPPV